MKRTPQEIVDAVKKEAAVAETWADLSNFVFDPEDGILAGVYNTEAERRAFIKTPQYKEIRRLISEVRARTGFIGGATPKKSGKFLVRLPRTLHAALNDEAEREGVSLNQLVVAKLSMQMGQMLSQHGRG
jgi:predicted HicB family RNase H-like nuclease